MDVNLLLAIAGIILTILTFVIGYRKTIGAQNERIRVANEDLSTRLAKHFATSARPITRQQIETLRRGQALRSGVKERSLIPLDAIRDVVITDIFNNEYLDIGERESAIKAVDVSFSENRSLRIKEGVSKKPAKISQLVVFLTSSTTLLGVASALFAGLVGVIVSKFLVNEPPENTTDLMGVLSASVAITAIVISIYSEVNKRSKPAAPDIARDLNFGVFNAVQDILDKLGSYEDPIEEVDFVFTDRSRRRLGVEVRDSSIFPLNQTVDNYMKFLEPALKKFRLDLIISVVSDDILTELRAADCPNWFLSMSSGEFENFVDAER